MQKVYFAIIYGMYIDICNKDDPHKFINNHLL